MKPPREWSFPYLNRHSPWFLNVPSFSTFAYWVGILRAPDFSVKLPMDYSWHEMMSYQINVEGQAVDVSDFHSMPEIIPNVFQPLAPVCFARSWSPIPLAVDRWGDPDESSEDESGRVLVRWTAPNEFRPLDSGSGDAKHFGLIAGTATTCGADVAIIGQPGWSYEDDDFKRVRRLRKLASKADWAVSTRTPD